MKGLYFFIFSVLLSFTNLQAALIDTSCAGARSAFEEIDISHSIDSYSCESYEHFLCYSHKLTYTVKMDTAKVLPREVGIRTYSIDLHGDFISKDIVLNHLGDGLYQKEETNNTGMKKSLLIKIAPYMISQVYGAKDFYKRFLLVPYDEQMTMYFVFDSNRPDSFFPSHNLNNVQYGCYDRMLKD